MSVTGAFLHALLFLVTAAAGFGLGLLASGWVASDWPTVDDTDFQGA